MVFGDARMEIYTRLTEKLDCSLVGGEVVTSIEDGLNYAYGRRLELRL